MIILRLLQGITGEARQLFQEPLQVIYIKGNELTKFLSF